MTEINRKYCILVVEDDPDYRNNMELILTMEGFSVRTAVDGTAASEMVQDEIPDLVLCDIMMQGMDGHAFFELLKQDRLLADLPFIFVTALADRNDIRKGMSAGADDYLTKPFTAEELVAAVSGRLKRLRTFRQNSGAVSAKNDIAWLRQRITGREHEVLLLVGSGATSKEIAGYLGISVRTVDNHRTNLMDKLDASNAAALAHWAAIAKLM